LFEQLDFEEEEIFKTLLNLYHDVQKEENKKDLEKVLEFYIQKNFKSQKNKENFSKSISNFRLYLSVFTYESEEENNIYLGFLTKMIDESKWGQI
jgi:hypothetical protein